jgi:cytidylate kinase
VDAKSAPDDGSNRPAVVTIFEAYGAGASYVAPRVAQVLGVPHHQQAFSSEEFETVEQNPEEAALLSRVYTAMGNYTGLGGRSIATAQEQDRQMISDNTRLVLKEAREGGVIVGRNGAFILSDWSGALHVRLDGPVEKRIDRAADEAEISRRQAARRQKNEDRLRAEMSIDLYGWDPRELEYYQLVLNTGRLTLDACVDIIVQSSHAMQQRATERT